MGYLKTLQCAKKSTVFFFFLKMQHGSCYPSEKAHSLTTIIDLGLSESSLVTVEKREPASSILD